MRKHKHLERWHPGYALLKRYVNLVFRLYLKNIRIRGKGHIPPNAPVILAPNHQNALMDALAVLYAYPGQPVFIARADIFKKKILASILTFLKLIPVYRIRDGYDSLQNNERVMDQVSSILSHHRTLVIFPEGNHGNKKNLRPLKKGICRMAFQAEERNNFKLGLFIVPVGLDYENYYKFQRSLMVNFGEPIAVDPLNPLYQENPSKAHNLLKAKIAEGLKSVMLQIGHPKYYEMLDFLREIYRPKMKQWLNFKKISYPERLWADRQLVKIMDDQINKKPEAAEALNNHVMTFKKYLRRLHFRPWIFQKKHYPNGKLVAMIPLLIGLFPFFFYGLINNAIPFFFPYAVTRRVKDPQFYSSIRNGMAIVLFPLFYGVQLIIFHAFVHSGWLSLGYLVSLPLTGYIAYHYYRMARKTLTRIRYNAFSRKKPKMFDHIHQLRGSILKQVDEWVQAYQSSFTMHNH